MLYLQSHFLRPACPFLNTGEKNTYGGTAGLLFMVRLSDLPVLWRWKTPGRLSIWGKPRYGIYRMVFPDLKENSAYGSGTVNLTVRVGTFSLNRPGFPGECFICELRLPDHRFRWKHNKLFLLLPEEYGPAFPAIVDCYTSPPT
ncbi:taurine dioxygenase, 2-oxoglutarate-dependent [Escherichia coli]|nr:taurine dioxygenase, 2-oxoglutarate-dependent [Escherichia coli]STF75754.1 taurine dioxygenase, 2-oxoglutarate-dependent [Escherichia coli]